MEIPGPLNPDSRIETPNFTQIGHGRDGPSRMPIPGLAFAHRLVMVWSAGDTRGERGLNEESWADTPSR